MSRDSVVGIATSYGLDDRGVGVRVPVGLIIFTSTNRPDRLWDPPNLLSNRYRGLFPRGLSGQGVKLTTHLQLVSRSRKCGSIHPLPIRLHGVAQGQLLLTECGRNVIFPMIQRVENYAGGSSEDHWNHMLHIPLFWDVWAKILTSTHKHTYKFRNHRPTGGVFAMWILSQFTTKNLQWYFKAVLPSILQQTCMQSKF
jgi:hypothetical protein